MSAPITPAHASPPPGGKAASEYRGTTVEVELVAVPDASTLTVELFGKREHVRIKDIDPEQGSYYSKEVNQGQKLPTHLGKEATEFAHRYFGANKDGRVHRNVQVILEFDTKAPVADAVVAERDNYGRLLCYVHTEHVDPTVAKDISLQGNFTLASIITGFTPYFTKYGRSHTYHDEFRAAEVEAMQNSRNIWSPDANLGGAFRRYEQLMPWWWLREELVEKHRALPAGHSVLTVRHDYDQILQKCHAMQPIAVFCDLRPKEGSSYENHYGIMKRVPLQGEGDGMVIYAGSKHHKFNLWIPHVDRPDRQAVLRLIQLRYAGANRNVLYVTGPGMIHKQKQRAQIIVTDAYQLSDEAPSAHTITPASGPKAQTATSPQGTHLRFA